MIFRKQRIIRDLKRNATGDDLLSMAIRLSITNKRKPGKIISWIKSQATDNPKIMAEVIGEELTQTILNHESMLQFILNLFKKKAKKRYPMPDRNNIIYKSNNALQVTVALLLFILISITGKSQVFAELGAGMTNKYFSAELQAGYRYNNLIASAGFISIPNNTQPVLFNLRGGLFLNERAMIYAGYVRNQMSTDFKNLNKNGWQIGAQYHMLHFDKGTVYIGANYTSGNYVSGQVGMSYNLSTGID